MFSGTILLVLANLVPLVGVLLFGWDLFLVLALFWVENVVIGMFGILRVALAPARSSNDRPGRRVMRTLFFCLHFGGFTFAHAMLLLSIFGATVGIVHLDDFVDYLARWSVGLATLALLVSHGEEFLYDVLRHRDQLDAGDAMTLPYRRILITQAGLILGGLLVERFGQPLFALMALVAVKILLDLQLQRQEKRRQERRGPGGAAMLPDRAERIRARRDEGRTGRGRRGGRPRP